MSNGKSVEQLELELMREYATKHDLNKVEGKLDELGIAVKDQSVQTAILENELRAIHGILSDIRDSLQWAVRVVLSIVIGGGVLGAAYFLIANAGIPL